MRALLAALAALALLLPLWSVPAAAADAACYPACAAGHASLVDALRSVGADSSFAGRQEIAARNGIAGYTGSAAQNIYLLNRLKAGSLLRPGGEAGPLPANLARVRYIAQEEKTCKATAVAMAVNLLRGDDRCTTAGMGGTCCTGIDGLNYTGSDGLRYQGVYRTDSYIGSAGELSGALETALAAGVPIVAAVHSTVSGRTRHHWVLVVGYSGGDYQIVDPAYGTAGSVADNVQTLSSRRYAFGLADSAQLHYGYVTFRPV